MSDFSIPSGETDFSAPTISIPGQKITWAGEGLQDDRFLFGTDSGVVLECGVDGSLRNMHSVRVGKDEESINSIGFYFDENALHLAATTRTDIILNSFFVNPIERRIQHAGFGAHGIKHTLGNYLVAPAGPSGIIVVMFDATGQGQIQTVLARDEFRYFYDFSTLGLSQGIGPEISVCACRSDGLVLFLVEPGSGLVSIKSVKVGDKVIDMVGVISIYNADFPLALIGLGKNRSLHFFRDPLHMREIDSLEFPYIPGTAYKLLRYGAHVILLTSKGICFIPSIVGQFHRGESIEGERRVRFFKIEAIDINIAFDKWLLVVIPDGIIRMELAKVLPGADIPEVIKRRMNAGFEELWKSEEDRIQIEQPVMRETELESNVLVGIG
jgi:hypothetical protein